MHSFLRILLILLFFSFYVSTYAQQVKTFTGLVTDSLNTPLKSANVLASPLTEGGGFKFAIADNKGQYRLELDKGFSYDISVSYLGYHSQSIKVLADNDLVSYHFKLHSTGIEIKEITVTHKYEPIIVKKDTLIYDVSAFTSGNERKMKEVLEKLPGIEVDQEGRVTVQGKQVTQMLVEGRSFFGGGSKLAVENIPADALDKIEVIDKFNEIGFLKEVSDSDELAMNVLLKEDKKKFVFGDLEAGGGNDEFHLLHAALFYYSPKANVSFIGDINNIGNSVFTYQDLVRFQGGISSFLDQRLPFTDLRSFTSDNRDVMQNKSRFTALNYGFNTSDKLHISGFGIFSKLLNRQQSQNQIEYLTNQATTFEEQDQTNHNRNMLSLINAKLDYDRGKREKMYYNVQFEASNNSAESMLQSNTNINNTVFQTVNQADNYALKQYVEWHKSHNKNHTTTVVLNHAYEETKPVNTWMTDREFMASFIPMQHDDSYRIEQIKKQKAQMADVLLKHYWVLNSFNHLYTNIGNKFEQTNLITSERQLLSDGNSHDFAEDGFVNDVDYRLNDAFMGTEYRFKTKKLINRASLFLHFYDLRTGQLSGDYSFKRVLLEPIWNSEYEFTNSEKLTFNYAFKNHFPRANQLSEGYTLSNYNAVFKGNALLKNEQFHTAMLRYTNMNMYRGLHIFAFLTYSKKIRTIRNELVFEDINRLTMPLMTDNPETNVNMSGNIQKTIHRFRLGINTRLSWFEYAQTVNGVLSNNSRSSQNIGVNIRTIYKKWPSLYFGYAKTFNHFMGQTSSKFQTDAIDTSMDYALIPSFVVKTNYTYFRNYNRTLNQSANYKIWNISLDYQKKNSSWGNNLAINNLLNNQTKINNSISDFLVSEQKTSVIPRVFLLSVRYKL